VATSMPRPGRGVPRRRPRNVTALVVATTLLIGLTTTPAAVAAEDFPSWSEVEAARSDESAKQGQITEITTLIAQIEADLAQAQQLSIDLTDEWETAQLALDEAGAEARDLEEQACAAQVEADSARTTVGQLVSSLVKVGGADQLTAQVLLSGENTEDFLGRLATASRLSQSVNDMYVAAETASNTAQALTDQAVVAESERARLADDAQTAMDSAIAASQEVEAQRAAQLQNSETLKAQLAVLTENRQATEADYTRGEEVRRAAAEAAAAAAAAAAASNGGYPQLDSGQLSDQGWTRPVSGRMSDGYGPRIAPTAGASTFHNGADLGAGCGTPVYAAAAGTVNYAGWFGGFGNWVQLSHGAGVQTSYAHNSQLLVGSGESVVAGQLISLAGTTGVSTGCHLHYEVSIDGSRVDPAAFMAARGAPLQ